MSVLRIGQVIGIGLERRAVWVVPNTKLWNCMIYCRGI